MAKVKPAHAKCSKILTSFRGLGSIDMFVDDGAQEMLNFRISDEGNLEKREGTRLLNYTYAMIRGYWEGTLGGYHYRFCVAGNTVYMVDGDEMYFSHYYTLSTHYGDVDFCEMDGYLYLFDGKTVLCFDPNYYIFSEVQPYAPLIGVNWHPTSMGDSNELPNLLTPRMRVHYLNTSGATVFYLPYYAKTIDCVLVGGNQVYEYTFAENSNYVTIPSAADASEVVIAFSAPFDETTRNQLLRAKRAFSFTQSGTSTMLIYGTEDTYKIYHTTPVTNYMRNYCDVFYPYTSPLYVTSRDVLFVGDSTDHVVTVCPHYDTPLIFNRHSIRMLYREEGEFCTKLLRNDIGCVPRNGAQLCGDAVLTISDTGVYRITSKASAPDDITVERVSDKVETRLQDYVAEDSIVFWNSLHRELWICTPQDESGTIWVWNDRRREWYQFDNLPANGFFHSKTYGICCWNGNSVYAFTPGLFSDDGNSYNTAYVTKFLDLGNPDIVHRSMHWSITASVANGAANVVIYTTYGANQYQLRKAVTNNQPEYYEGRIHTVRHRYFRFRFSTTGSQNAKLYRAAFYAKN